jgi:hypothetical protein
MIHVEWTPNLANTSTAVEMDPNHESPPIGICAFSTNQSTTAAWAVISDLS